MNHVYRIIWNETTGSFAAVAETASGRGKKSLGKKARAALAASVMAGAALAEPTGGQVSAGQGVINRSIGCAVEELGAYVGGEHLRQGPGRFGRTQADAGVAGVTEATAGKAVSCASLKAVAPRWRPPGFGREV